MKRSIYFLSEPERLLAWRLEGGPPEILAIFQDNDTGAQAFGEYLSRNPWQQCYFISHDQQILVDEIPLTRRRDRQILINRKLEQHFPGRELRTHTPLPAQAGRKGERLQLLALDDEALERRWLQLFEQRPQFLLGIFSEAQAAMRLANMLALDQGLQLLLFVTNLEVRAYAFFDGGISYIRCRSIEDTEETELAGKIHQEIRRLSDYLQGQYGNRPQTNLLASRQMQNLLALPEAEASASDRTYALEEVVHEHRLPALASELPSWPALCVGLLATYPPPLQYAPPQRLAGWRNYRKHRSAFIAALLISIGLLACSWHQWQAAEDLAESTWQMQQEADLLLRSPAPATAPSAKEIPVQQLQSELASLRHHAGHPGPALLALSQWLEQAPDIQLLHINWKIASTDPSTAKVQETLQVRLRTPQLRKLDDEQLPLLGKFFPQYQIGLKRENGAPENERVLTLQQELP